MIGYLIAAAASYYLLNRQQAPAPGTAAAPLPLATSSVAPVATFSQPTLEVAAAPQNLLPNPAPIPAPVPVSTALRPALLRQRVSGAPVLAQNFFADVGDTENDEAVKILNFGTASTSSSTTHGLGGLGGGLQGGTHGGIGGGGHGVNPN